MKIVTWNCNGAFRRKFAALDGFDVDILIIQECENPAESKDVSYLTWAKNYLWIGKNKNKGLGVFAKTEIKLTKLDWSNVYENHEINYFLPCLVNENLQLVATWAHHNNSPTFGYIGQVWKYLELNLEKFDTTIFAGDFNSNKIWDKWDRWWNHSDVVKKLESIEMLSLYHDYYNEEQGKETHSTFFLQRNLEKKYHIDYIYLSKSLLSQISSFEIGNLTQWLFLSDHVPLFFSARPLVYTRINRQLKGVYQKLTESSFCLVYRQIHQDNFVGIYHLFYGRSPIKYV